MIKIILSILLVASVANAFNIPGEVPLFNLTQPESRLPAVDLLYQGTPQTAESLRNLEINWIKQRSGLIHRPNLPEKIKQQIRDNDISKLQPSPQSIQKNWVDKLFLVDDGYNFNEPNKVNLVREDKTREIFKKIDNIGVDNGDVLQFIDVAPFKANNLFDFRVRKQFSKNKSTQFRIYLGPLAHNMMLRKNFLRKLGYKEPGFKYLSNINIKFVNDVEAEEFIDGCFEQTGSNDCFGLSNSVNEDPRRWISNIDRKTITTDLINPETGEFEKVKQEVWDYDKATLEDGSVILKVQDVVIYEETSQQRLALGFLPHDSHSRQRIYNSLLMAYNIVDIPESINSLSPVPFSVKSQKLILTHNYGQAINEFTPDIYDLKWMARKIASFSRKDFEHIVSEAYYPKEVEVLLVELLIARRNYMQKFFFAEDIDCRGNYSYKVPPYYCLGESSQDTFSELSSQFATDLKISFGEKLVNGRLTVDTRGAEFTNPNKWWVGYGSRFSYHQIESPLVMSEILAYFRSILQSSFFDTLINKAVNEILTVDRKGKVGKILKDANDQNIAFLNEFIDQLNQTTEENQGQLQLKTVPFSFEYFPTASGQLILNRNVIIGTQSGVDNQVQLVDTFGYLFKAGVHGQAVGVDNLNLFNEFDSKVDEPLIGYDLDFTFLKRWTHLRPIVVQTIPGAQNTAGPIKKALQESLKKVLIPKIIRDFKKELESVPNYSVEQSEEEKAKYKEVLERNYQVLNKYLKPGESLILSTSIGPSMSLSLAQIFNDNPVNLLKNITGSGELVLSFLSKFEDLSRIHIQRKADDTLVIYKTNANQVSWETTVGYKKFIPITRVSFKKIQGKAQTRFYTLKNFKPTLGDTEVVNPLFANDMQILANTVSEDSFSASKDFDDKNILLNRSYNPYIVWHNYKQNQFNFRFLFFNLSTHGLFDEIEMYSPYNHAFPQYPDGESTKYLRYSRGIREGLDFQKVAVDVVNLVFEDKDIDAGITIPGSGDSADTLFGRSASVSIVLDAKVSKPSAGLLRQYTPEFGKPFLKLHYKWKGGVDIGLKPKKAKKLLNKINNKLNLSKEHALFDVSELSKTSRLQLYQAKVDLVIYEEGFYKLLSRSPMELERAIRFKIKNLPIGSGGDAAEAKLDEILLSIFQPYSQAHTAYRKNNYKRFMKKMIWVIQLLQQHLEFKDFIALFEKIPKHDGKIQPHFRNIYMRGLLTGFKKGDERIDPIQANEIGFPRKKSVNGSSYDYTFGDIELIKNRIGISDGEFYLNWLIESYL